MTHRSRAVALAAALAAPAAVVPRLTAQELTTVAVSFRVDSALTLYTLQLTAAQTDSLQRIVADSLVARLRQSAQFFRYAAGDTGTYRLTVILDRRNRSSRSDDDEVSLHARITAGARDSSGYWHKVRDGFDPRGVGRYPDIRQSMLAAVNNADYGILHRLLKARVPVARGAMAWADATQVLWILPYARQAACMESETVLVFLAKLPSNTGPDDAYLDTSRVIGDFQPPAESVPAALRGRLGNAKAKPDSRRSTGLDALRQAAAIGEVIAREAYLVEFKPMPTLCLEPVNPLASAGGPP